MGQFVLGAASRSRFAGVHPDLVRVANRAIKLTTVDFSVIDGVRTLARQRQLFQAGKSRSMNSRHLTGHALDIAPFVNGKVSWNWDYYHQLAPFMKQAAAEEGVPIEWGGDWVTFKDGVHWQLPWSSYPVKGATSTASGG